MSESTLTYGEIEFSSFAEIFYNIKNNYGGIPAGPFYDLGSGTGKGCLAAALLHPGFEECFGVELLKGLYDVSTQIHQTYVEEMPGLASENPDLFPQVPTIRYT